MPGNTTPVVELRSLRDFASRVFFYVYALESLKDGERFKLIYFEGCLHSLLKVESSWV